ncbi:N-acetylmuramoyl-L-alanine amidase [Candidatus Gromoviella agglomerans]|uniref:peptidoglycan recognition protein family protein n=1 Tax=Candidatus Gromoviella agglomerans TaxID=2806609 RepID=UPI001E3C92EF|nr:N-acetylmuramoyl-L-alanine amidase [Candidatus Gromoviella agglomerans]UFX98454.1 Peptidoglycan recognition domain-containing protein [Candidatus Gromoviella agglomerans]
MTKTARKKNSKIDYVIRSIAIIICYSNIKKLTTRHELHTKIKVQVQNALARIEKTSNMKSVKTYDVLSLFELNFYTNLILQGINVSFEYFGIVPMINSTHSAQSFMKNTFSPFIVYHHTGTDSLSSVIHSFKRKKAFSHLLIAVEGTVFVILPLWCTAYHAGYGKFYIENKLFSDFNNCLGVEFVSNGFEQISTVQLNSNTESNQFIVGNTKFFPFSSQQNKVAKILPKIWMQVSKCKNQSPLVVSHNLIDPFRKFDCNPLVDIASINLSVNKSLKVETISINIADIKNMDTQVQIAKLQEFLINRSNLIKIFKSLNIFIPENYTYLHVFLAIRAVIWNLCSMNDFIHQMSLISTVDKQITRYCMLIAYDIFFNINDHHLKNKYIVESILVLIEFVEKLSSSQN